MIPTGLDNGETCLTTDEQFNINRSNSHASLAYNIAATCAESHGYHVDKQFKLLTSRTDRPRLAHEVYWHWMTSIGPLQNDNSTCKRTRTNPLNRNDLLIAAYSGPNLMYRK